MKQMGIVTGIGLFVLSTLTVAAAWAEESPWAERNNSIGAVKELPSGVLSRKQLDALLAVGEDLFVAKFTSNDGAGRPAATQAIIPTKARHRANSNSARLAGPDSNGCSACHNDPVIGGAGDFVTNVFVSEGSINS